MFITIEDATSMGLVTTIIELFLLTETMTTRGIATTLTMTGKLAPSTDTPTHLTLSHQIHTKTHTLGSLTTLHFIHHTLPGGTQTIHTHKHGVQGIAGSSTSSSGSTSALGTGYTGPYANIAASVALPVFALIITIAMATLV
jgi:hypothetical protein